MAKFRRADGIEFEAVEGSETYRLMQGDGSFTLIDTDPANDAEQAAGREARLSSWSKKQLLSEAAKRGLAVTDKMTKDEILAAFANEDPQ